jgi:hypothetical protein
MKRSGRSFGVTLLLCGACLVGCASSGGSSDGDLSPDALYTWGTSREQLEREYGTGRLVWIVDQVPADEFAAAIVKSMVSQRRPRPSAYEVFVRPNLGTGGGHVRDYVFFNDALEVLYSARYVPAAKR